MRGGEKRRGCGGGVISGRRCEGTGKAKATAHAMRERFWTLDMSEIIPIPSRYTIPGAPMPHAQSHAATRDPVVAATACLRGSSPPPVVVCVVHA